MFDPREGQRDFSKKRQVSAASQSLITKPPNRRFGNYASCDYQKKTIFDTSTCESASLCNLLTLDLNRCKVKKYFIFLKYILEHKTFCL